MPAGKQNIVTYKALLWVLFGDRCDYFINLNKIHDMMDLPEVQQLCQKFSPEICCRISWAIIDDGRSYSTWSSPNKTLTVVGPYLSLSLFWWVSWRMYISATQSCGGISRQNGWHSHGWTDSANQRAVQTHRPTPRGAVLAELEGGGITGGGGFGRLAMGE